MRRRQQGAAGFLIAILLLALIGGVAATLAFLQSRGKGERSDQDTQRLEKIKPALVQFVALNGRLPCPANPTENPETGDENRTPGSATCISPAGTVPWRSIGIRREDAIDSWGWRISYRAYTGTQGSLTQDNGSTMVNCDTVEAWSAGRTAVSGSTGGLCRNAKDTKPEDFLTGKGLNLSYFGAAITDAAFVLVSHGPSGLGAFTSTPPSVQKSNPASAGELANLTVAGPFVAQARSAAAVGPENAAHFDDVVAYAKLSDLVRLAGLWGRDWPETVGLADATLSAAALAAALETGSVTGGDLGRSSINLANARITATNSGSSQNLTLDQLTSGDGIGGVDGINNQLTLGEAIRIDFNQDATQFGVTLNAFGIISAFGSSWTERVTLTFYNSSDVVVQTVTKSACRGETAAGTLSSYSVSPGVSFRRVDVAPALTTVDPTYGIQFTSSLVLSAFKTCTAAPCVTAIHNATTNACP